MSISNKLLVTLAAIFVVLSVAASITLYSLAESKQDAQVLSALGRQGTLSQTMAKSAMGYAVAHYQGEENAGLGEYEAALAVFSATLTAAQAGGEYPADHGVESLLTMAPIDDAAAQEKISEIEATRAYFSLLVDGLLYEDPGSKGGRHALQGVIEASNVLRDQSNELVGIYTAIANRRHAAVVTTTITTVAVMTLVLAAAGFFFRFRVMARVDDTVRSMREIAQGDGDLTRRLDDTRSDELGRLAAAFNQFTARIQGMVEQIQRSGSDLQQSSQALQAVAAEANQLSVAQQREIASVARSMEEMSSAVREVSRNTQSAHDGALRVDEQAVNGREVVTRTVEAIRGMSSDIEAVSEVVNRLDQESASIGSVLDVISGVAEQTNLLALNAAIEAARAGEQGRGFAVVADEVRTLASRTQSSTEDIQKMIENLQQGTGEAVRVMTQSRARMDASVEVVNQADEALHAITDSVAGIKDMSTQIASAAEQQDRVASQVSANVDSINQSAAQTVDSMDQVDASSQALSSMASRLGGLVGQFKV